MAMGVALNRLFHRSNSLREPVGPTRHWLDVTPTESDDVPCSIASLDVKAHVCGLYADVEQTMEIRNPNKRPISAPLVVPMPDGAVVCGFALDIDGVMVDGVVVSKEKARVVFETEQRRGADPGLVEAIRGNAYRTRVYPVPANGSRTVRLRYVAPLQPNAEGMPMLELPMPAERLVRRSVRIEVEMLDAPAPVVLGLGDTPVSENRGCWCVEHADEDVVPSDHVRVGLPALPESLVLLERDARGEVWFSASEAVGVGETDEARSAADNRAADIPLSSLTVLWDASGSRADADHEREIELVRSYCTTGSFESFTLVVFGERMREAKTFASADELLDCIRSVRYDGGTDLVALADKVAELAEGKPWPKDKTKHEADGHPETHSNVGLDASVGAGASLKAGTAPVVNAGPEAGTASSANADTNLDVDADASANASASLPRKAYILFTDGIDTLRDQTIAFPATCDVLAIVGGESRDVEAMRQACSGLAYGIDRAPRDASELARALAHDNPERLWRVEGEGIADACDASIPGSGRRTVVGRLRGERATLKLGNGKALVLEAANAKPGETLAYAWAAKRVSLLALRADDNADELLSLGRRFGIASPATSLLVLESLDQWLRYDIEPPESLAEMHAEWKRLKAGEMRLDSERGRAERHRADLEREWANVLDWWKRDYRRRAEASMGGTAIGGDGPLFCVNCGRRLEAGSRFCPACGSPVAYAPDGADAPDEARTVGFASAYPGEPAPVEFAGTPAGPREPSALEGRSRRSSLLGDALDFVRGATMRSASAGMPDAAPMPRARMSAPMAAQGQAAYEASSPDLDFGATDALEMAASPAASEPSSAAPESSGPALSVRVRPWMPDAPYLKALDEAAATSGGAAEIETYAAGATAANTNRNAQTEVAPDPGSGISRETEPNPSIEAARDAYFAARPEFRTSPSFFLDCAGWFMAHGDADFGACVLSNLAEMRIEDAALLRVMGWRLREAGKLDEALSVLRRVVKLRPEDSQSYRDVALVLDELASAAFANGDEDAACAYAREAGELYRKIALTPWERRPMAIGLFAVEEYNALRAWAENQPWKEAPSLPSLGEKLEGVLECDLRITLAWDADETDVDIHVTEPSGEEAYYGHRLTTDGGRVSEDITDGYGPELYEIRHASEGPYTIRAHYYASHQQTVFGPATCTLTVYTDWGRPGQAQHITSTRLDQERSMVPVGTAAYGAGGNVASTETGAGSDAKAAGDGSAGPGATDSPETALKPGMTPEEVRELLGDPTEGAGEPNGSASGTWTWRLAGGRALAVTFSDGKVARVAERMPWGEDMVVFQ